jgi:hypothetical protein
MSIRLQEWAGALIAGAGIVWLTAVVTEHFTQQTLLEMPPRGPLEVCAGGIIIWLVGKWRRSVQLR